MFCPVYPQSVPIHSNCVSYSSSYRHCCPWSSWSCSQSPPTSVCSLYLPPLPLSCWQGRICPWFHVLWYSSTVTLSISSVSLLPFIFPSLVCSLNPHSYMTVSPYLLGCWLTNSHPVYYRFLLLYSCLRSVTLDSLTHKGLCWNARLYTALGCWRVEVRNMEVEKGREWRYR